MKTFLQIAGFLLFIFGFLSIILSMIGLKFSFLAWIDHFGRLPGLLIKLAMTFGGVIMVYIVRMNPEELQ